jgi:hypothetical protein
MDSVRTHKMIARYESGLLSASEVAIDLLYELVCATEIDIRFLSSLESLPNEVMQELFRLIREIREADFRWIPPLLRAPASLHPDATEYSAKLRQVIAFMGRGGSSSSALSGRVEKGHGV